MDEMLNQNVEEEVQEQYDYSTPVTIEETRKSNALGKVLGGAAVVTVAAVLANKFIIKPLRAKHAEKKAAKQEPKVEVNIRDAEPTDEEI